MSELVDFVLEVLGLDLTADTPDSEIGPEIIHGGVGPVIIHGG